MPFLCFRSLLNLCLGLLLPWLLVQAAAAATPNHQYVLVPDYYGQKLFIDTFDYTVTPTAFSRVTLNLATRQCSPNSVAVSGGNIYIVCNSDWGGLDQVLVFSASTHAHVKTITGRGPSSYEYFSGASLIGAVFDKHGNLWVSGYSTNDLLRIPAQQLAKSSPLVDREVVDSPDSPAGLAMDTDYSIWVVGQYSGGIAVNFTDAVLNQSGSFLHDAPLNPTPRYCISNNLDGCQPTAGLFNNPEGVAVFNGDVWVSNNGGSAPGASLVRLVKQTATTLTASTYGGTVAKPFSCPGGLFTALSPSGTSYLWVNDEGRGVVDPDCGATAADQGDTIGKVLSFTVSDLYNHKSDPQPEETFDWGEIKTSSPGFGGVFVYFD